MMIFKSIGTSVVRCIGLLACMRINHDRWKQVIRTAGIKPG